MNPYLEHLAERLADAPDFFASALRSYARSERLDEAGLAAGLGCTLDTLTHLRLCRMPRDEAALFWPDVKRIAERYSVNADLLAEISRRGQSLVHLRAPVVGQVPGPGFLLAARDDARLEEPPAEETS
jgi:hypothetical protein